MEIICKRNNELTYQELEILFQMYKYNNKSIIKNEENLKIKNIEKKEFKDEWINNILKNNSLICIICLEQKYLIGFALLTLNQEENYINEFHILEQNQRDGKTFRAMAQGIFKVSQPNKDFTGRIWTENYNAQKVFKSMGALPVKEKYHLKYEKLKEWLESPKQNQ